MYVKKLKIFLISVWNMIFVCSCNSSGFFGIIACLMVASTSYDILCTVMSREFPHHQSYHLNWLLLARCFLILGKKSEMLLPFSVYTNGMKLLSYKKSKSPDMMNCLNGIKAISTQWVVLGNEKAFFSNYFNHWLFDFILSGHTFAMYPKLPFRNLADIPTVKWSYDFSYSRFIYNEHEFLFVNNWSF